MGLYWGVLLRFVFWFCFGFGRGAQGVCGVVECTRKGICLGRVCRHIMEQKIGF